MVQALYPYNKPVPCARVSRSAAKAITTATDTAIDFDQQRFVTDAIHSTSSNNTRMTAPYKGRYYIGGSIEWAANATGVRRVLIKLNGSTVIAGLLTTGSAADTGFMTLSTFFELSKSDYVELYVRQDSGGNLNVNASGNNTPEFYMFYVTT